MTIRFIGPLRCGGALSLVCGATMFTATVGHAQSGGVGIYIVGNPDTKRKISDNESPRPQDRTTVKSSKSNTSDRMGSGGGRTARPPGGGGGFAR
jgi:hypothetical protein